MSPPLFLEVVIVSNGNCVSLLQSARLYTASFMRILLRARVPLLSSWGMEMLVLQLYDQSKAVAMEALSVISEACEDEVSIRFDNLKDLSFSPGFQLAKLQPK